MSGKRVSLEAQDLEGIAASYGQAGSQTATLNLDHRQSGPALGRVSALRYDASRGLLLADIEGVPGRLAQAIERGRWPGRSAELGLRRSADGGIESVALRGLALLGARRPAVEGLPPMPPRSPAAVDPPAPAAEDIPTAGADSGPIAGKAGLSPAVTAPARNISFTGGLQ
jgi:hypothetical protein